MHYFGIAFGGAVGAVLRYWLTQLVHAHLGRAFPYGTLVANLLGSLLMGFLAVWMLNRFSHDEFWRLSLLTGLLGGFTTFSAFSIETFLLVEAGTYSLAAVNVLLSVLGCLLAVWLGVVTAKALGA